jgi:hypothetical protein
MLRRKMRNRGRRVEMYIQQTTAAHNTHETREKRTRRVISNEDKNKNGGHVRKSKVDAYCPQLYFSDRAVVRRGREKKKAKSARCFLCVCVIARLCCLLQEGDLLFLLSKCTIEATLPTFPASKYRCCFFLFLFFSESLSRSSSAKHTRSHKRNKANALVWVLTRQGDKKKRKREKEG